MTAPRRSTSKDWDVVIGDGFLPLPEDVELPWEEDGDPVQEAR